MRILGRDKLEAFKKKYPQSRKPLERWENLVTYAKWRHFSDLRRTFSSADYDDLRTIFDISGNKYRIDAIVQYKTLLVIIRDIMTHEKYDKKG